MAETQEERNAELFEQVWGKATARVDELKTDETEHRFLKAMIMGGTVAAEMVINNTFAKQFWGEGKDAWAGEISQLFSFIMLSQCYRWVAEQSEASSSPVPKEVSATKLIYAFDTEPEQSLDDFVRFDNQYDHDLSHKAHIVHTASFLLARICEITGHKCIVWNKIKFPVDELTSLAKKGIIIDSEPIRSQDDINVVTTAVATGLQAMNKFFDESGQT